jgi:chemotaxis protein methyltransferase CheR
MGAYPPTLASIADADFDRLREFFYRRTGIFFEPAKKYFVEKRVLERIRANGDGCFAEWFSRVRFGDTAEEIQHLINALTVNETYFYREDYQLRCMVDSLLGELTARRTSRTLRIWSMPCASGEEPYSIGLYLLEHWPLVDEFEIEIVGSDIDTAALRAAAEGRFSARSVQNLPYYLLQKYFTAAGEGDWRICEGLRSSVRFAHVNLVDRHEVEREGAFDLVFCRNLLIYFDEVSQRLAAENLFEALVPGGFICLGHSESMSRISPLFEIRKFPDAIVYQRPRR